MNWEAFVASQACVSIQPHIERYLVLTFCHPREARSVFSLCLLLNTYIPTFLLSIDNRFPFNAPLRNGHFHPYPAIRCQRSHRVLGRSSTLVIRSTGIYEYKSRIKEGARIFYEKGFRDTF